MSSFDIAAITVELDSALVGFRINNIYQINPKTLLLKLHGGEGTTVDLLIEAGKRIHTTSYVFEKPSKPPDFCMALRKYLENGRIDGFQQHDFERVVEIEIRNRDNKYCLIIELFAEGNIILLGPNNKILHALAYRKMKDRNILRGETFAYPPVRGEDPTNLQREDLSEIRGFGQLEVVKALTKILSIGGYYAEEVLLRADVDKNASCSSLKDEALDAIFRSLKELLSTLTEAGGKACIFVDDKGDWVDVAPVFLKKYGDLKHVDYQTFNEALDEYYVKVLSNKQVSDVREPIERRIAKLERILQDQEKSLQDLKRKVEDYSRIGDTVYRHFSGLDVLIQRIMQEKRSGKSWLEIVETLQKEKKQSDFPAVYFDSVNPEALSLQVSAEGQTFNLNLKKSVQENAADYYEASKKAKKKTEGLEEAIKQSRERIEKTRLQIAEAAENVSKHHLKIGKREWYEKFRWFHSSDDFLVIGGRDASTNETIIKKYMEPQDLVFHADIPGSPFVLIKTQGRTPPEQTVKEAAQFAASYSHAWKENLSVVDTYWVLPQQVSKRPPSGQYLPRGSFMIYDSKNYVKNVPLEVAIGIKREEKQFKVIGGPPEAIVRQTSLYARLVPGGETSGKLAKQVRSKFAQLVSGDARTEVLRTPLEEIQQFIPSGRGSVS